MDNSDPGDEQPIDPTSIGPMHGPHVGRGHGRGLLGLYHAIDELENGPCQHPSCALRRDYEQAEYAMWRERLGSMLASL